MKVVGVEKDDAGGTRTPRGGIVGLTCSPEGEESVDAEVRIWQLGSIVSLARFVASQEVRRVLSPLFIHLPITS